MKAVQLVLGLALSAASLAGCGGSDTDTATTTKPVMPDVTGQQLDVALGEIKEAGFEDDVEVTGGGTFGIVDESNWTVCEQSPQAGDPVQEAPQLTVDRSCDDSATDSTESPDTTGPTTTEPASSTTVGVEEVLTASNNAEFAALLAEPDYCSDSIQRFAATYGGRTIEFDGNIAAFNNHGDYDTRFDILIHPGDFDPSSAIGPAFQFRDVNIVDLNLTGPNVPDTIGLGDNLHVKAEVGAYDATSCLFFLTPLATSVR